MLTQDDNPETDVIEDDPQEEPIADEQPDPEPQAEDPEPEPEVPEENTNEEPPPSIITINNDEEEEEIIEEEEICQPDIEDCFEFEFPEFVPNKEYNHIVEYIIIGLIAWLEVLTPIILFFAYESPRIAGISYNLNYRNAWRGIWVGLLISNISQMVIWPLTFFIKKEKLYKAYFRTWLYFGTLGRGAVDFFVSIQLLVAAVDWIPGNAVRLSSIWTTFGVYLGC